MTLYTIHDFSCFKSTPQDIKSTIKFVLCLTIIFLTAIFLNLSTSWSFPWLSFKTISSDNKCNIYRGTWIPYPDGPYYTNQSCGQIFDQQNCMKFGRPDTEFMKWRWQPYECQLPLFDALDFLELVRGKSMAFVGDSLGRNQMQSLMCLLSNVTTPSFIPSTNDPEIGHWLYSDYNFTLVPFWSPYLVKAINADPSRPKNNRLMSLYLDRANEAWTSQIETFDYVIISAARWFFGPQIFFENDKVVGCYNFPESKLKDLTMFYGYKKAFRTTFKTLRKLKNFKGVTFLRALSPAHFENGEWNKGGNCIRTRPVFNRKSMKLSMLELELYKIQMEEMRIAERQGRKRGLKFGLIDATDAMMVRPDGHPNHYGHWAHENVSIADCVHWCLPGPIDTWNEFLLYMLKDIKDEKPHNNTIV